jgi:hypothetical protein
MRILAFDPGSVQSAHVLLRDGNPVDFGIEKNDILLTKVAEMEADLLAVEYMKARGMPTANEELATQFFAGRLVQAWGRPWEPIYRQDVKLCICEDSRAKDSNIRQALIDLFGGKEAAIGTKKNPGPLYGISKDVWSALAIGITCFSQIERPRNSRNPLGESR